MELIFNTHGNDKQKRAATLWCDAVTLAIVYGGSKMSGKSFLGCSLIFGDAFTYPETFYFIARKSLNDLRKFTIPSIKEVFRLWNITDDYYKYNGQDNFFELYNGSRVYLIDAKYMPTDPDYMRFGSSQFTRGWIEEAGELSLSAKNNLQATVGRWNNKKEVTELDPVTGELSTRVLWDLYPKVLLTCNPAHNFLYSDFYKPHKENRLPAHNAFVQALPTDNKKMSKEYYFNLENSLTQTQKLRLLFGLWEYDDSPEWLLDNDAVNDMFCGEHVQPGPIKRLTADIALKGRDRYVTISWAGLVGTVETIEPVMRAPEVEADIRRTAAERGISRSRITVDSDGVGAFVGDYLRGVNEFHGNAAAVRENYGNLKDDCGYMLAEKINRRQIRIVCDKETEELLKEELMFLRAKSVNADTSKKRLMTKDEIKRLLGRSPDIMDNLLMRMEAELKPAPMGMRRIATK